MRGQAQIVATAAGGLSSFFGGQYITRAFESEGSQSREKRLKIKFFEGGGQVHKYLSTQVDKSLLASASLQSNQCKLHPRDKVTAGLTESLDSV